ncbi:hypothetical protein PHYSODRAFT_347495 [Phytophthora sojae]|uniref:Transmembrane protein n=1 Tax=Phytophthora sojae (strain P6497) TaxID=1094619 RepID=G5A007_PHYSP|nr:hypothetical protein PHYSODRAFT_347495 [Phytophthora sojae]EGZ10449.1 hypothetical protein PHYSODRAFT_347495 [Phytophthora sojae]|eukprot:XP_009533194.1 hypothetical protein PHYSODRAFT_347495 [Phytophthora sojae]
MDDWPLAVTILADVRDYFEKGVHPMVWAALGVAAWHVITPVLNVLWVFGASVRETGLVLYFFGFTCVDRYMSAIRSSRVPGLEASEYAWAALSLLVVVPIAVLREHEQLFGMVGEMWHAWCVAIHQTVFLFLPDAGQLMLQAARRYACALGEAAVAMAGRVSDGVYGVYVQIALCVSVVAHAPRIAYDVLEGLLHGSTGVAVVLGVWNAWCGFSLVTTRVSGVLLLCGLYSHLVRRCHGRVPTKAPKKVARSGLGALRERKDARERAEKASLNKLRGVRRRSAVVPSKPVTNGPEVAVVVDEADGQGPTCPATATSEDKGEAGRGRQPEVGESCHGSRLRPQLTAFLTMLEGALEQEEARLQEEQGQDGLAY